MVFVVPDLIAINLAVRVKQNDARLVTADVIVRDDEVLVALDDEDSLPLALLYQVFDEPGVLRAQPAQRDVGLQVGQDMVRNDLRGAPLHDEYALSIV